MSGGLGPAFSGGPGVQGRGRVPSCLRPSESLHPEHVAPDPPCCIGLVHRPPLQRGFPLPRVLTQVRQERPDTRDTWAGTGLSLKHFGNEREHVGVTSLRRVRRSSQELRWGLSPSSVASEPVAQMLFQAFGGLAVPYGTAARGSRNTDLNGHKIQRNVQGLRHLRTSGAAQSPWPPG